MKSKSSAKPGPAPSLCSLVLQSQVRGGRGPDYDVHSLSSPLQSLNFTYQRATYKNRRIFTSSPELGPYFN